VNEFGNQSMTVITRLNLGGRTEEALNFYQEALGAEITSLVRFGDSPDTSFTAPDFEDNFFTPRSESAKLG